MELTGEGREQVDPPVGRDLGIIPLSQRKLGPPGRAVLVWRGLVLAFGLLAAVGFWDHPAAVLFAWVLALLGLGHSTMIGRLLGTVAAVLAMGVFAGIWPEPGAIYLDTPEETARKVLVQRAMTAGAVLGAGVGWVALGVGGWYRERESLPKGPRIVDPQS